MYQERHQGGNQDKSNNNKSNNYIFGYNNNNINNNVDFANYGAQGNEGESDEVSSNDATGTNFHQREKLPLVLQRQLLIDLRDRGGIESADLKSICNINSSQYGQAGSSLRRRIQRQVDHWKRRLGKRPIQDLIKEIERKLGYEALTALTLPVQEKQTVDEQFIFSDPPSTPIMSRQLVLASPRAFAPAANELINSPDGQMSARISFSNSLINTRYSKYKVSAFYFILFVFVFVDSRFPSFLLFLQRLLM